MAPDLDDDGGHSRHGLRGTDWLQPDLGARASIVTMIKRLPGGIRVDVVGETFYRKKIREAIRLVGAQEDVYASLVPEPMNPYDPNAVKVLVAGQHVGHLSRDVAIIFGPVARRITELGCDAQCLAMVTGGAMPSVVLDLGTPEECLKCLSEEGD